MNPDLSMTPERDHFFDAMSEMLAELKTVMLIYIHLSTGAVGTGLQITR